MSNTEEQKVTNAQAAGAEKKKRAVVIRPQNSKVKAQRTAQAAAKKAEEEKAAQEAAKAAAEKAAKAAAENAAKAAAESAAKAAAEKAQTSEKPAQKTYQNNNGERRQYNNGDRNNGERRQYNNGDRNNGERRQYNNGDRSNNGERRQYNNGDRSNNGERRQFNNGDRNNNGERRQFNNGDRQYNNNGERRQYNNGDRNNNGERRQFNNGDRQYNNNGERRQYNNGDRNNNGERRQYNNGDRQYNNNGERRQYNNNGDRQYNNNGDRQFGDRNNNGERRQYNNNGDRQFGDRSNNGERRQFNNNGDRNNNRAAGNGQGQNRSFGNNNARNGQGGSRSGGGFGGNDGFSSNKPSQTGKGNKKQENRNHGRNEKTDREDFRSFEKSNAKKQNKAVAKKEEEIKTLVLPEKLTIKELAEQMKMQPAAIVKKLFMAGQIVTINQEIDYETAEGIALDFDFLCEQEVKVDVIEELLKDTEDPEDTLVERPPVICVMGHVDHGKTSLLDAIRNTNVIAKEAGGITQHIGAYMVTCNGKKITFLDTPGHEAFTAMRLRGAMSTDIAVLVVAADDGVMPQTVEAISHAKAAGVEVIVAINKIDKPGANIDRVKQELAEYGLISPDWGGTTEFVPVSAKTGEGIEDLLEMILLTAEVKELKANPDRNARGLIIEAKLDKGRGPVATVLVQKGTLRVGDYIACGASYGKVRALLDENERRVKEAGPSKPVAVMGLNSVPGAGEVFVCCDNEKDARSFAETFIADSKEKLLEETKGHMSLDDLFSQIKAGEVKELELIVKADVQGSVEAVKQSLLKLSNDEVVVKIIHGGVGAINESDVTLAMASNAIIIGFNVRPDAQARATAEREKVDMRLYNVIYQAIADIEAAMKGMLDPVFEEQVIGHGLIRQTFKASGVGTIAGVYITDGKFVRGCKIRVSRRDEQIFDGDMASLKRFKDDVKEVTIGYECGVVLKDFTDLREDDTMEAYQMVQVERQ